MSAARKVLVTGASRGIGRAIALAFGQQGMEVYATATGSSGVKAIQQTFDEADISGDSFILDVQSPDSIQDLFSQLPAMPDILVNNAGITRDNLLVRMNESDWSEVIETNLNSLFHTCKLAAKAMMKARWGRIINITSISGLMGNPGQCNYAAAKAGMIGFSKSLARELAARNITVNCIAPGFIETDMTRALPDTIKEDLQRNIPLGRFGTAAEVAAVAMMLASENGGYITGETICVSGGLGMS